jgi:hypothetical protein
LAWPVLQFRGYSWVNVSEIPCPYNRNHTAY